MTRMPSPKPLVQVACVCEKVLVEPDGVPTLVRIVDTYNLRISSEKPVPEGAGVNLTAFVSVKSGEAIGEFEIGIRLKDPEGKLRAPRMWPVVLNGGEQGANLKIDFILLSPMNGLYWFDVLWREEVLTSIPFRIKYSEPTGDSDAPNEVETR
jgi:hypothetical protein